MNKALSVLAAAGLCLMSAGTGVAHAGPWAEIGDSALRSDIELLADAGVIDNVTMTWPLPWTGILTEINAAKDLDGQSDFVRAAARRVRERAIAETRPNTLTFGLNLDATNSPDTIRGFNALGRQKAQSQLTADYLGKTFVVHLAVGAQTTNRYDHQSLVLDDSYVAQRLGDAVVYAGYRSHWWGPGWNSSMILSNNARPFPQIGITRVDTSGFQSPWLSWIGPWQAEFFVGVLDGPRVNRNVIYDGLRFAFSPLRHLEIAFTRTNEMCGTGNPSGQPCKPLTDYFHLTNNNGGINRVNDEGSLEFKYSGMLSGVAYQAYVQFMNEDGPNPFIHSRTSHLAGANFEFPMRDGLGRLTLEYASSVPTEHLWWGPTIYGFAYTNYQFVDGMRYRDRTLGFSLDTDSQLLSAQAMYADDDGRTYELTYYHASISNPNNPGGIGQNVVTTGPVTLNQLEVRTGQPFKLGEGKVHVDLVGRYQDDQPRPSHGGLFAAELAVRFSL